MLWLPCIPNIEVKRILCSQGAGALAILVMAFTAGLGWRSQGWGDDNPVSAHLASLWIVFQPLLFSLIGIGFEGFLQLGIISS